MKSSDYPYCPPSKQNRSCSVLSQLQSELGTSCRNCCNLMMREIEKLVWILTLRENKFEKEK
ncbi:unnamed protein product [Prunus brigantina]